MPESKRDPAHVRTYRDADACFSMARSLWEGCPIKPTPEALQATFATLMIHTKDVRNRPGQASAARAPAPQGQTQQAPPPAAQNGGGGFPAACLECGGEIYDNRKDGPDKPQWRCKNKACKDAKGYTTSEWSFKKKGQRNTAYAQANADRPVPTNGNDFGDLPEALDGEDDDLPF